MNTNLFWINTKISFSLCEYLGARLLPQMHWCTSITQNGSTSVQFSRLFWILISLFSTNSSPLVNLMAHVQGCLAFKLMECLRMTPLLWHAKARFLISQEFNPMSLDVLFHIVALNKPPEMNQLLESPMVDKDNLFYRSNIL